jgi:hypothetical protein
VVPLPLLLTHFLVEPFHTTSPKIFHGRTARATGIDAFAPEPIFAFHIKKLWNDAVSLPSVCDVESSGSLGPSFAIRPDAYGNSRSRPASKPGPFVHVNESPFRSLRRRSTGRPPSSLEPRGAMGTNSGVSAERAYAEQVLWVVPPTATSGDNRLGSRG